MVVLAGIRLELAEAGGILAQAGILGCLPFSDGYAGRVAPMLCMRRKL